MKLTHFEVDTLGKHLDRDVDLFICCASYESRCRSVADNLPLERVRNALVAENEHKLRYESEHGDYLRKRFGDVVYPVSLSATDPIQTADSLWYGLRKGWTASGRHILIDITTFTHEALLILVRLLMLRASKADVIRFAYVGATEYSVGDKGDAKWLSKGVSEVRSVLGYPGELLPSRKPHLIVLVGFEHERASELIKAYEPSLISLGHGRIGTSTDPRHDVANQHFHNLVTAMALTYGEVRSFEFACDSPLDAQSAIEKQIRGARGYNTVIAPMNTKLSTLGAVLTAARDESVQLCYARAKQYNYRNYSLPGSACYLVELPELFETRGTNMKRGRK